MAIDLEKLATEAGLAAYPDEIERFAQLVADAVYAKVADIVSEVNSGCMTATEIKIRALKGTMP